MQHVNEHDLEYRHGDHGPKYLFRGPRHEWGIIRLGPGHEVDLHHHAEVQETFYFEEGAPTLILNGEPLRVRPGDAFQLEPRETHRIVNDSPEPARIVFIKTPYLPEDKVS